MLIYWTINEKVRESQGYRCIGADATSGQAMKSIIYELDI